MESEISVKHNIKYNGKYCLEECPGFTETVRNGMPYALYMGSGPMCKVFNEKIKHVPCCEHNCLRNGLKPRVDRCLQATETVKTEKKEVVA